MASPDQHFWSKQFAWEDAQLEAERLHERAEEAIKERMKGDADWFVNEWIQQDVEEQAVMESAVRLYANGVYDGPILSVIEKAFHEAVEWEAQKDV